jgi:hypothetical protein
MNPTQLIKKVEYFQSLAGLLKVPNGLLEKVTDWAVGAYANALTSTLNKALVGIEYRDQVINITNNLFDNDQFRLFIDGNHQAIIPTKDNTAFNFTISYFNSEEIDEKTGLKGVYDWVNRPPTLELFIYRFNNDKYNFLLTINEDRKEDTLLKNITLKEVLSELDKNVLQISRVWGEFYNFINDYMQFNKEHIRNMQVLRAKLSRYPHEKNIRSFKVTYDDLSEYHDISSYKDKNISYPSIGAEFVFDDRYKDYYEGNWSGLWTGEKLLIKQFLPSIERLTEKRIDREMADIKETVRHELQHASQSFLKMLKKNDEAGLPSKKIRDPNVDQYGRDGIQQLEDRLNVPSSRSKIDHGLRDIEFYTDLTDNIAEFKSAVRQVPLSARQLFFHTWIGTIPILEFNKQIPQILKKFYSVDSLNQLTLPQLSKLNSDAQTMLNKLNNNNQFFQTIKIQPLKYNKAVKEFYKEVSDLV